MFPLYFNILFFIRSSTILPYLRTKVGRDVSGSCLYLTLVSHCRGSNPRPSIFQQDTLLLSRLCRNIIQKKVTTEKKKAQENQSAERESNSSYVFPFVCLFFCLFVCLSYEQKLNLILKIFFSADLRGFVGKPMDARRKTWGQLC